MFWRRHSGLQIQVLRLYRDFLRISCSKEGPFRNELREAVRQGFRKNQSLTDFDTIEHLLRTGKKQLQALTEGSITGIRVHKSRLKVISIQKRKKDYSTHLMRRSKSAEKADGRPRITKH